MHPDECERCGKETDDLMYVKRDNGLNWFICDDCLEGQAASRISYQGKVMIRVHPSYGMVGNVFIRTDYHEDGSETDYYGVELTDRQYDLLLAHIDDHVGPHDFMNTVCSVCGLAPEAEIHTN